jgi:hypothetical protein
MDAEPVDRDRHKLVQRIFSNRAVSSQRASSRRPVSPGPEFASPVRERKTLGGDSTDRREGSNPGKARCPVGTADQGLPQLQLSLIDRSR